MKSSSIPLLLLLSSLALATSANSAPYLLDNGPGDGTLSVGVDGYGSFGGAVGANSTDAFYDAAGPAGPGSSSFESGVAVRFGNSGARQFLTSGDIGGSGLPINPAINSGFSSFTHGGLSFTLSQSLVPIFDGGLQSGTILRQDFGIQNTSQGRLEFELVRYLDGDLNFYDPGLIDGGGRLFSGGTEVLFETDGASGGADPTTFVGITAEGGTIPATGRYEISAFSGLRTKILTGAALGDIVAGDSGDADQFIDAGNGYDVTLALNNLFSLDAGASAQYVTLTIFGNGAPMDVPPPDGEPNPVPDATGVGTFITALISMALLRNRRALGVTQG